MKKIYTLLLSAAVAVSASAAAPVAQKAFAKDVKAAPAISLSGIVAKAPAAQAPAKAIANIDEVYGSYKVDGVDMFEETETHMNSVMKISAGEEANEVFMQGLMPGLNILGTVDLAAGTITVPFTNLGKNSQGYDILFANVLINTTTGQLSYNEDPVVFKVTETGLELQTQLQSMGLAAAMNGTYAGWFEAYFQCTFTKFDPDAQWEDTGITVQYTDDLFLPLFKEAPMTFNVPLQKSKDDPAAFALVDPYKELIGQIGAPNITYDDAATHRMIFHVDGTDLVWFEDFNSGILYEEEGITSEMVFYTQVGQLCESNGAENVAARYPTGFGHFENGTITYPITMSVPQTDGTTKNFYNWLVEWNGNIIGGGNDNDAFKISGLPTPAGVKDIAVDTNDENAPVEYFNLQGARVSEPAAGLYIRRQGKTVTKVVIK